jgi:hypothetical protein
VHQHAVALHCIDPGKPIQNVYGESFPGWLRDEGLNGHWFLSRPDARQIVEAWRLDDRRACPTARSATSHRPSSRRARRRQRRRGQRTTDSHHPWTKPWGQVTMMMTVLQPMLDRRCVMQGGFAAGATRALAPMLDVTAASQVPTAAAMHPEHQTLPVEAEVMSRRLTQAEFGELY